MADCTAEENLTIMTKVMSNKDLHLKAARTYKRTGTTSALDVSEDDLITGDAGGKELNMRQIINEEVHEVERRWHAGELKWNFRTVMSFITPYPKRAEMDEWKPGMDDEATPDPDLSLIHI